MCSKGIRYSHRCVCDQAVCQAMPARNAGGRLFSRTDIGIDNNHRHQVRFPSEGRPRASQTMRAA